MKQKNGFRLAGNILTAVFAALFLIILILVGYTAIARARGNPLPKVFGLGSAVVLSGSMEPELPVGSLLFIHEEKDYQIGDIVTYEDNYGSLVTHRLVSLENGEAVTKGDANNTTDAPFPASKILGKVTAVLPGVGSAILWLQTPLGICTIMLICGLLIILPWLFRRKGEKTHDGT